jgi:large subunit ribosomal protein L3
MQGLIGEKIGMTRFFNDSGVEIPVTVIKTGTNVVHQVRTLEKDKYAAVQLGFGSIAESRVNKPELGHFKKHSSEPTRVIKEFFS